MSIRIEKMAFPDLAAVSVLAAQLGYPHKLSDIQTRFLITENLPKYALFVAKTNDEKVVGYIQVNAEPHTLLADDRAEVSALVVDETIRSRGIGAALLRQAEKWAKENGFSLMRVRSNIKRSDAHRFYEREFYTVAKSWHLFTKQLE